MPTATELASVRRVVMACMETGNIHKARTTLTEFAALFYDAAMAISIDVTNTYGIVLL